MKHLELFEGYVNLQEKKEEKKWIQKAIKHSNRLHSDLNIAETEAIPMSAIEDKIKELHQKVADDPETPLSKKDSKLLKRLNLAKTLKSLK
jgi:hypothetical protein